MVDGALLTYEGIELPRELGITPVGDMRTVELPVEDAMSILEETAAALREEGRASLISVSFGVALLPDEPTDATDG